GLAAWISFDVVLSSDNPVIPGSQWGGSEWSRMGISRVRTQLVQPPLGLYWGPFSSICPLLLRCSDLFCWYRWTLIANVLLTNGNI
ncbi:unnamed protein product, partial [Gulo gulo]